MGLCARRSMLVEKGSEFEGKLCIIGCGNCLHALDLRRSASHPDDAAIAITSCKQGNFVVGDEDRWLLDIITSIAGTFSQN
mmetsp:Transcript_19850/g.55138  ORF Transcript_19850/g.55138 Transcript_19850/m.55138 type:complete len:81 (-) Transcript_19850:13-255(-)